eukprot:TRINITY_DN66464_c0_g1_i1.p2 TRINITY_DN66464_c0_g1~~TRINITY_DN66464_c0_g1_i1.p2  ORF type:complete len:441 (+),score=92.81 TRINITY_DN66464_c0_g1_i1:117-1439(+)
MRGGVVRPAGYAPAQHHAPQQYMSHQQPPRMSEPGRPGGISPRRQTSGSSECATDVPRKVCSCGTTVLFPGNVSQRSCWRCGTMLHVNSGPKAYSFPADAQTPYPPVHTAPASMARPFLQQQLSPTHSPRISPHTSPLPTPSGGVQRPAFLGGGVAPLDVPHAQEQPPSPEHEAAAHHGAAGAGGSLHPERGGSKKGQLMNFLLVLSLCVNGLFLWRNHLRIVEKAAAEEGGGHASTRLSDQDTDQDGVPDHHDFCPRTCADANDTNCSLTGWRSGKATDFDGDGCQDGVEDDDRDNDGIADAHDACPLTPMHYSFVSNGLSDFDGDGCADGVEDTDNDADGILNSVDACPRTRPGALSDSTGCCSKQRMANAQTEDVKWWEVKSGVCEEAMPDAEEQAAVEQSFWHVDLVSELKGASAELIVGACVTLVIVFLKGQGDE